jgi:tetratricopeptide (TPR) repeat protein
MTTAVLAVILAVGPSAASDNTNENAPGLPPGHPKVRQGTAPPGAEELIKQLDATQDLKQRKKSFEVAIALGKLYYAQARYPEAIEYLTQATQKAEPTRAFVLEQRKGIGTQVAGSAESAGCPAGDQGTMETLTSVARDLRKRGKRKEALACARAALQPGLEAEELRGNALFLTGDPKTALAAYERVLAVAERPSALYARAMVLFDSRGEDLKALRQAKDDLGRFLRLEPTGPKAAQAKKTLTRTEAAVASGGLPALVRKRASRPAVAELAPAKTTGEGDQIAPLTPEMIQAVQNTERTPELQQGLAKLVEEGEDHLAHRRYQEALDAYKRVIPFQPDNGRAKAGMAWSLIGLRRQPMADRVWSVAVSADPAAVDKLGDLLAARGDKEEARAVWTKLGETAPSYADSSGLRRKLK